MLRTLLPFLLVQVIQSRLLRIALLPPRDLQEDRANHSVSVELLHWRNASARVVVAERVASATTTPRRQNHRALVQWPSFRMPTKQYSLRFKEIPQVVPAVAAPLFSRSTATKLAPHVTTPMAGNLARFQINTDLKLLEAPSTAVSRALVLVGNRAVVGYRYIQNWTKQPFCVRSQSLSKARRLEVSKARRLEDLSMSFVHFISQSNYGSDGATCSAVHDQRVSKHKQRTQRSGRSSAGRDKFSSSGSGCIRWFCSCVSVNSKYQTGFPTLSPTDSCGSHEERSQSLVVHNSQEASAFHHQQKAAARMYKQARQLLLMKQAAKKRAEADLKQAPKKEAEVSPNKPLVELNHVLEVHADAHAEYGNLLVAVVTLLMLLAMSQQTVKLPQDPASAWSGAIHVMPTPTTPPAPLSGGEPFMQSPENCDVPPAPEDSCDALGDGGSGRNDVENSGVAEESHVLEAGSCLNVPTAVSAGEAQVGKDAQDESLDAEEDGTMDDKEASEKFDDQDEVSSCVSSCGTSDGYEKIEIGGSIFMKEDEDDEEEDANNVSVTCT